MSFPSEKDPKTATKELVKYYTALVTTYSSSLDTILDKLCTFSKYVPRQDMTKFLARFEVFKKVLNVHGSVIGCGVYKGQGLLSYAKFSSILEPINHQRRIIGFDTFKGFPSMSNGDKYSTHSYSKEGGLSSKGIKKELLQCIELYDMDRALSQIPKVELVEGDVKKTIPKFLKEHPQTLVSLLVLDMDIYEPTLIALKHFLPRMPKGAIIMFDEANSQAFTGETVAMLEKLNLNKYKLERFTYEPNISYLVL